MAGIWATSWRGGESQFSFGPIVKFSYLADLVSALLALDSGLLVVRDDAVQLHADHFVVALALCVRSTTRRTGRAFRTAARRRRQRRTVLLLRP